MKQVLTLSFRIITYIGTSQNYKLDIQVDNLGAKEVYLANFYGDKNSIIDTSFADTTGNIQFELPGSYHSGMYSIFLDKNIFFELIFNKEDISIFSRTTYISYFTPVVVDHRHCIRSLIVCEF